MDWERIHERILSAIEDDDPNEWRRAKEAIDYIILSATELRRPLDLNFEKEAALRLIEDQKQIEAAEKWWEGVKELSDNGQI